MRVLPLTLAAALALGACSTMDWPSESEPEPTATEGAAPQTEMNKEAEEGSEPEPEPQPEPEPVPDGPELHQVGELIERPTADLIVETLEERELIATDFDADFEPRDGERLWYVDITWTLIMVSTHQG